jgi:ubiquinone/menaquinone biosynthesis C-methylase UbiE
MNARHSGVTDWGLSQISIGKQSTILDVGCGGGRTVSKLAALATEGKVYGIDFSSESVAFATRLNRDWIDAGRVEILEASVSQLPFPDAMFDLVTAVETHFWWPDLASDMREVFRVVKPRGTLIVIAEVYKGAGTAVSKLAEKNLPKLGMRLLTSDQHRDLLTSAGFTDVRITTKNGWICAVGRKP